MRSGRQIIILFLSLFLTGSVSAGVILSTGFLGYMNTKEVTAVTDKGVKYQQQTEKGFYPGVITGFDVPFMPNSFGLAGTLGVAFGKRNMPLNQYNIENYEFYIEKEDGNPSNVITTEGNLKDFNLQEKVGRYLRENPSDVDTQASDIIIVSSFLFKYNTPVEIPLEANAWKKISLVLSYINPYFGLGFTNIILNRKLELAPKILKAIEKEHGAKIINDKQQIVGLDAAPDPDFYFSFGGGFNVAIPKLKLFGQQIVFTLEFLYHINLSPDDQQKPYDDQYVMKQTGMTFRVASGTVF